MLKNPPPGEQKPAFRSVLLVEDEAHLARALKIALRKLGLEPRHATTLAQAREELKAGSADFLLLDRALPDGDGLDLCRELRAQGYSGTILMLTARGDTPDRIEGLVSGADDYLPKPFSWEELGARILALYRRASLAAGQAHAQAPGKPGVGDETWACDPDRLRVKGKEGWVELTPLEYKLAAHLIAADGAIVGRDDLLKHVWGFTLLPKTRTVDHFLGRLRKHFEKNPEDPKHFLTVRGAGYRFSRDG